MLYTNAVDLKDGEIKSGIDVTTFESLINVPMTTYLTEGGLSVEVAYALRDRQGRMFKSRDGLEFNYVLLKNLIIKYQGETELVNDYFNVMGTMRDDFMKRYPYLDIAETYLQPVSIFRNEDRLVYVFEIFIQGDEVTKFLEQDKENKVVDRRDLSPDIQSILDTLKFKFIREE